MQVRKQQLELDMEQETVQIGKGVCQDCILLPCLFYLFAEELMRNSRLDEAQVGIMIARRNTNKLRYVDDTILMAESKEELKNFLMKVKEESEKNWLKTQHSKNKDHGIQIYHFMENRWENNGNSERLFSWAPESLQMVSAAMKSKGACFLEEKL